MSLSSLPLFATVRFAHQGDALSGLSGTFRVPLTPETTVRRLAKDAMQRLALSRHRSGHKKASSIVVTEVYVGGDGGGEVEADKQPRAEVFAQDIVTQVVHVKDEVIHMTIQTYDELEALRSAQTSVANVSAEPSSSTSPSTAAPAHTGSSSALSSGPCDTAAAPAAHRAEGHLAHAQHATHVDTDSAPRCDERVGQTSSTAHAATTPRGKTADDEESRAGRTGTTTPHTVAAAAAHGNGCAETNVITIGDTTDPPATCVRQDTHSSSSSSSHNNSNSTRSATWVKKQSAECAAVKSVTAAKRRRTGAAAAVSDDDDTSAHAAEEETESRSTMAARKKRCVGGEGGKRTAAAAHAAAEPVTPDDKSDRLAGRKGDTISRLRAQEMSRLRWGPEAHKHFATNYVSSPEKLMRKCFTRRKKAPPPPEATKTERAGQEAHTSGPTAENTSRDATRRSHGAHLAAVGVVPERRAKPPAPVAAVKTTTEAAEGEEVQVQLPKGWGPDAARCFPLNYVSSPDKLARQIRERHRQEKKEKERAAAREREQMEEAAREQRQQETSHTTEVTRLDSTHSSSDHTSVTNDRDSTQCAVAAAAAETSVPVLDRVEHTETDVVYGVEHTTRTMTDAQTRSAVARQLHFADLYDNTQDDSDARATAKDVSPESRPTLPHVTMLCADHDSSAADTGATLAKDDRFRDTAAENVDKSTPLQPWLTTSSQNNVFSETGEDSFTFTL